MIMIPAWALWSALVVLVPLSLPGIVLIVGGALVWWDDKHGGQE